MSGSFKRSLPTPESEDTASLVQSLHCLVWPKSDLAAFRQLLDSHPELVGSRHGRNDETLLHRATRHGKIQFVDLLLERKGTEVNAQNSCGRTALHLAAHTLRGKIADRLLEAGADVDVMDAGGDGALHLACQAGSLPILKALMTQATCAEPGCAGGGGNSLLHYAARYGHLDLMLFLINSVGHDVDARNHRSETPFHLASGVHKLCKCCWCHYFAFAVVLIRTWALIFFSFRPRDEGHQVSGRPRCGRERADGVRRHRRPLRRPGGHPAEPAVPGGGAERVRVQGRQGVQRQGGGRLVREIRIFGGK